MIKGLSPLCKPEGRKEEPLKSRECPSAGPWTSRPLGREAELFSRGPVSGSSGSGWAGDPSRVIGL